MEDKVNQLRSMERVVQKCVSPSCHTTLALQDKQQSGRNNVLAIIMKTKH